MSAHSKNSFDALTQITCKRLDSIGPPHDPEPEDHPPQARGTGTRQGGRKLWKPELPRMVSYSRKPRWRLWKKPNQARRPMGSSTANAAVTASPGTRSMWAHSKASAASPSRPSSTPTQKQGFAKLYDTKTPITAAEMLNDQVLPFFEEHEIAVRRILRPICNWRKAQCTPNPLRRTRHLRSLSRRCALADHLQKVATRVPGLTTAKQTTTVSEYD
jgi:hypothetical protein